MKIHRFVFAAAGSIALFSALAHGAVTNARVDSGEISMRHVCAMPIETDWAKVGMKGQEGMTREAEDWNPKMEKVIADYIGKTGADVALAATPEQLESNENLRQTVLQLQQKYDGVSAQLNSKPKEVKKGRYTMGDSVALLPCSAQADVLVFIHAHGSILTGGKKVFGALVAGQSRSTAELWITFVDAKSGEALAFTKLMSVGDKFITDPEGAYGKGLTKELGKMRVGSAATKKK